MKSAGYSLVFMLFIGLPVAGCASPEVVEVKQVGDADLNCEQLRAQYEDAQDFEAKARKDRGVTGTNVAAAVLFWPALIATYSNTDDAIDAAKDRQKRLEKLAADKHCNL